MSSDKKSWTLFVIFIKEDECLRSIMQDFHEEVQWYEISILMKERFGISTKSGKQCRERWHNHLDPNTRKRE